MSGGSATPAKITVELSDGHAISRTALAALVAGSDDFEVIATTDGADATVRGAMGHRPDLIVYDPAPPLNADSIARVVEHLVVSSPTSAIMILTTATRST